MYDYVDRPVASLDPGGRFLVWSMRRWVEAMTERACPPNAIGPAFAKWKVIGALPHFHIAMMLLNREGLDTFHFAPPDCETVAEDEAVLLHLVRSVRDTPADRMRSTLGIMVTEEAIAPLLAALTGVAVRLSSVGLLPQISARENHIQDIPIDE